MSEYKLPPHNLHHWSLSMTTELIDDNKYRARKYDLRVAAAFKYKKFYYKYYLGDNVIFDQLASHQEAHYVIVEMNIAFHKYLNQKDAEYHEHCENEKKNWATGNLSKSTN